MEQRLHRPVAVADGRAAGRGAHADGFVGALAEQHFAQHKIIFWGEHGVGFRGFVGGDVSMVGSIM